MPFPPTDWGDFTPEEYEVGAPATSNHFERWFRNVVAAFQGADGAPRVALGAIDRLTPGNEIRGRIDAELIDSPGGAGAASVQRQFAFSQAGTVRLSFDQFSSIAATIIRARTSANTTVATFGSSSGGYTTRVADVPVLPGDLLTVSCSGTGSARIRNFRLQTNGESLWPGVQASLDGNVFL